MKKFIAVMHDDDEQHLREMFQLAVGCLRENGTRKVVPLLTRVVLFEFEDDRRAAYTLLASRLGPADQIAVFEIASGYSGSALRDYAERLDTFFRA